MAQAEARAKELQATKAQLQQRIAEAQPEVASKQAELQRAQCVPHFCACFQVHNIVCRASLSGNARHAVLHKLEEAVRMLESVRCVPVHHLCTRLLRSTRRCRQPLTCTISRATWGRCWRRWWTCRARCRECSCTSEFYQAVQRSGHCTQRSVNKQHACCWQNPKLLG